MIKIKKLQHYWRKFFIDKHDKAFIRHNRQYFRANSQKKESIILMELNESCSNLISYSYVASILAKKYNSSIFSFYPRMPRKFQNKMLSSSILLITRVGEITKIIKKTKK